MTNPTTESVLDDNVDALQKAVSGLGITAVDLAYSYHYSNDEGYTRIQVQALVSHANLRLKPSAIVGLDECRVDVKMIDTRMVDGAWKDFVETKPMKIMQAMNHIFDGEFLSEDFMKSHGNTQREYDGDDDDEDSDPSNTTGKVRFNLSSKRLVSLDTRNEVIPQDKPRFTHAPRYR